MKYFFSCLCLLVWLFPAQAQSGADSSQIDRLGKIRSDLDELVDRDPAFGAEVDISVGQFPLDELLRNIAKLHKVSLSVKDAGSLTISCNFARARIDDLLYYLCQQYNLEVSIVGNIVSIFPHKKPVPEPIKPVIDYSLADSTLSYDIIAAPLIDVAKQITQRTGVNLVVPQSLYTKPVSGYASRMPLGDALYALGEVNALDLVRGPGERTWTIADGTPAEVGKAAGPAPAYTRRRQFAPAQLSIDSTGLVSATIDRGNIYDIVLDVCTQLGLNYFFIKPVSAQTSIYLRDAPVKTLFKVLFTGTPYSYYEEDGIFMFGESQDKELFATQVIPMKYRTVEKLAEVVPENLKTGIQVQAFPDLNAIIASGDQRKVSRVEQFLKSIDRSVPLITIDVLIVDVTKRRTDEAGIESGLAPAPVATSGTLSPGINLTLGAGSINNLINSFNGFGVVKLGKVSPNFYMNLKFLEETGHLVMQSTPKLSTLNGHEAQLKSGQTMYYKEVQNSYIGTQNPVQNNSYTWKSVEANLTVKIKPYVSEDRQITLEIEIEQSEFTERIEPEAPPGLSSRSFKSLVRVANEEMVLLGGIERNTHEKSSSGVPGLSRVPVLKWLFGSAKDNKSENKLNVFIKPTVWD